MRWLLVALLLWLPAAAQEKPPRTILDFRQELALSDAQVQTIRGALSQFHQNYRALQSRLEAAEGDYQAALQSKASLEDLRARLKTVFELKFEQSYADLVGSRTIEGSLTPTQLTGWNAILARERATSR